MWIYSGLRGQELVWTILLTPVFVPVWIIGGVMRVADGVRSWWWNS